MANRLQHITDLAEILYAKGVKDIIVSPGSRNAPLIQAFYNCFGENCISIVDERSAAYFALGQSLITKKPTVLICTSGTALLDYAPAIAEAFYQKVPLLVITADRPPEWIEQQDNQAIQQKGIYENYIKASYSLPVESALSEDLWLAHRIINEAFFKSVSVSQGPVHINVPLREPLYEELPGTSSTIQIIEKEESIGTVQTNGTFFNDWEQAKSILMVCGQFPPEKDLKNTIQKLLADSRVVVVAEPVSNIHEKATITNPEIVLNSKINYPEESIPELVIYFGGQVVSKKVKVFLRNLKHSKFWFISSGEQIVDTFQNINAVYHGNPISVLKGLEVKSLGAKSSFKKFWEKENRSALNLTEKYTQNISFSDLQVFNTLSESLPGNAIVFAGNSSVVRYLLYFNQKERKYYSNRGVSGIDGCLSTAAGLATKTKEQVYVIVGDLAFGYDSNALWNRRLPKNLKIILVNNEGGGIFHLLKGPSENDAFLPLVNAHHPVDFKKLTEAYGLKYSLCLNIEELSGRLNKLIENKTNTEVLEIRTPNNGVPQVTKDFFKFLNTNYGKNLVDN